MAYGSAVNVVSGDFTQDLVTWKGNLATNMRQSTMGGDKRQPITILAQNTEYTDVDSILEILLTQIFRNRPFLADCTDIELFAGAERQLALRRKGCDAAYHCLIRRFQLDEKELPVHRDVLELISVRQNKISVEFHASLLEATENSDDLFSGK